MQKDLVDSIFMERPFRVEGVPKQDAINRMRFAALRCAKNIMQPLAFKIIIMLMLLPGLEKQSPKMEASRI